MRKLWRAAGIFCFAAVVLSIFSCKKSDPVSQGAPASSRIYVANEDAESISVIDANTNQVSATINMADGGGDMLMVHNVQAAPDGKTIWATLHPMLPATFEQVAVIDASNNTIKKRIYVGQEFHLAHVVLDNTCSNAFVTCTDSDRVVMIETTNYTVVKTFYLSTGHSPHGMRYCNGKLYVANLGTKSLSIIDVASGTITDVALGGVAVQTAITPDSKYVFISLYDTREVARYEIATGQVVKVELPSGSQGPIQLYSTPDSKKLFVCDQGKLNGMPVSNKVYVLDVNGLNILGTVITGNATHGVVVSKDGRTAYVTNSDDNTVSVIDVATQTVKTTVNVGLNPNGIAFWCPGGGMP